MLALLCGALPGLVLLCTGTIKALDSGRFGNHLRRYQMMRERMILPAVSAVAVFECTFGMALLLHLSTSVYAGGILLFASFIAITLWGARAKKIDDCGCYGNQVDLTPVQSASLDGLYIGMLGLVWWQAPAPEVSMFPWKLASCAVAGSIAGLLAWRSRAEPLVDLLRLRPGARWKTSWLLSPGERDLVKGTHFVVFLSRTCPACKSWIPLLNIVEVQPDLPAVTGIVTIAGDELQKFSSENVIRFPLVRMRSSLVSQMVDGFPTAALIENGVVKKRWLAEFPEEISARINAFYNAVTPNPPPTKPSRRFAG